MIASHSLFLLPLQITLLVIFWSAGLPTIMNPAHSIAVARTDDTAGGTVVSNANLYFFAWFALGAVTVLAAGIIQETWGIGLSRTTPTKAARWYGLTASALVVLCSAARAFHTSGCNGGDGNVDDDDALAVTIDILESALQQSLGGGEFCRRSAFGVAVGVLGFLGSALVTGMIQMTHLTLRAETIITAVQLMWWCFGVGYITFEPSPGATIGNLYFATWISFSMSVILFANSFRESVAHREALQNSTALADGAAANDGDHDLVLKPTMSASGESRFDNAEEDP